MRLKHIKLAGFKSFVDPTKVPFEQQMTAIVGPNGCGKSNIIDAVRWVLGESSAKNLRGDAMTDVIFNGASTRKPVGQASVELVFDNVAGKIQGSMADRNQVSIRRVVNRDSQNSYYLNGSKCRRKDITDIFLGTGLGPRSYAIIEQGTISRLIESKPQELRVFIEEAAGISKYKERRRDTEVRIRHTRENLARLTDIRLELEHQLDKLHQQAEAAQRFKTLKGQERETKAQLAVLRWQKFDQHCQSKTQQIMSLQTDVERKILEQKAQDIRLFSAKQEVSQANESIHQLQGQKIALTNNIARIEQQIKHVKQQQAKLQSDKQRHQQQIQHAQHALLHQQTELKTLSEQYLQQSGQFSALDQQLTDIQQHYAAEQSELQLLQQQWHQLESQREQSVKQQLADAKQQAKIQAELEQCQTRLETVQQELAALNEQQKESQESAALVEQICELELQIETLSINQEQLSEQQAEFERSLTEQQQIKSDLQGALKATLKQIEFLQQKLTDKADWQQRQQSWLQQVNGQQSNSLQEKIQVETGWEYAAQVVLSHQLQASCVQQLPLTALTKAEVPQPLRLLLEQEGIVDVVRGSLAEKISHAPALTSVLNHIKTADSIEQTLAMAENLLPEQSVICPQGLWLGHQFVSYGVIDGQSDYLRVQQELSQQVLQQEKVQQELSAVIALSEGVNQSLVTLKNTQTEVNRQLANKHRMLDEIRQQHALNEQSRRSRNEKIQALNDELQQLDEKSKYLTAEFKQQKTTKPSNDYKDVQVASSEQEKPTLQQLIGELQQRVSERQNQQQQLSQQKHQAEMAIEKTKHQQQQMQQSISRLQDNIEQFSQQQANNSALIMQNSQPLIDDEQQLQQWLEQMTVLDAQLSAQQNVLILAQQDIEKIEQNQRTMVEAISKLKEQISELQLDSESYRLKASAAKEQLQELGQDFTVVEKNMPENAREAQWQARLIKLSKDIQTLGAINLAAIDEFETQLTRKNYLDQQDQDLNLAITTLESAIEKIDKESRQKFKLTFDKVNQDLQSLFPKVFGGGSAYLSLTGDDLLETGITIMARPPGKKNSTIHLLSGGEKALTALSLVFAIFRLNPAPFCMLDEVDAPLDDANVERFCNLVEEMSQTVQFIYISHNKIAMEMASHLTGVTMFEAGVSRMVAVDIDEAIAMAEVS